jgi:transporter family-2 protein
VQGKPAGARIPGLIGSLAALVMAFTGGVAIAVQVFVNGHLGRRLGSPELAAAVNNTVAVTVLGLLGASIGALGRASRRLRAGGARTLRPWQLLAGINGGFFLIVAVTAAPRVGVALVTVATVCGQTAGSLVVDWIGMGPSGVRPLTAPRVAGAVLGLVAVVLGAAGSFETARDPAVGLLCLAVLAGAGVAVQQAALGHVARATGEPVVAGAWNVGVGMVVLMLVAFSVTGGHAPGGWSAPPIDWVGGVLAAGVAFTMARVVATLGVLRLTLAIVAGQSLGGVAVDVISPAHGETITVITVLSVLLTLAAVAVSGRGALWRRPDPRLAGDGSVA